MSERFTVPEAPVETDVFILGTICEFTCNQRVSQKRSRYG